MGDDLTRAAELVDTTGGRAWANTTPLSTLATAITNLSTAHPLPRSPMN
jgi:hypothetical protein